MGEGHAGAAAGLYPNGVEACRHEEAVDLRRRSKNIAPVRREAFRAVEELPDAHAGQAWDPLHRVIKNRGEVIEILGKLSEGEILRDSIEPPRLRSPLEGPEQQLSSILL